MNIIVLIKQVPNTAEVKIDPKTGNLIREGVESIINPDDMHAIEASVRLKEQYGGSVTAISMGPPQAIDAISEAMAMGIDRGVLLTDRAFAGADTWATSTALGRAIQKLGNYDLVIAGRQAIDGDTAQIGPQVAEYLGIPHVSYVCGIEEVREGSIIVKRLTYEGLDWVSLPLPGLITVTSQLNTPGFINVGRLLDACKEKAPIYIWNVADLGLKVHDVGLMGSLTQVIKTFSPKSKRELKLFSGNLESQVEELLSQLRLKKVI
ncbi:MAG: electron transfer flavoprotein subunit beta/FixA family protein [Desulfatiglandales bacterium]